MKLSDWLTIIAIIVAPIVALWIGGILQHRSDAYKTKLTIFGTLMAQRHDPLSLDTIKALNLIDAAFSDNPAVREAWTRYYTALSDPALNDAHGGSIRADKRHDLLLAIVKALGLSRKISTAELQRGYMPTFVVEMAQIADAQRKAALETIRQLGTARPTGTATGNGITPPQAPDDGPV
jgi:hypothetical protein